MQRVTLTIEAELAQKLKHAAKSDDRSVSSVVRRALTAFFNTNDVKGAKAK